MVNLSTNGAIGITFRPILWSLTSQTIPHNQLVTPNPHQGDQAGGSGLARKNPILDAILRLSLSPLVEPE